MNEYDPSGDIEIINLLPDPIVVLDTKGTIQWCNDATSELTQTTREGLIGKRFTKFASLRLGDIPKYVKIFASILKGNDIKPFRVTWDREDGTIQESEVHIRRITNTKGKKAILVVAKNITGQEEIREAYRLAQLSIDNATDPIYWIDEEANFVYANEAACDILQYSIDELTKMKVHDVDPAYTENLWPSFVKELKSRKSMVIQSTLLTKDKCEYPVEISAQHLEHNGNAIIFAYLEDISKRKAAEETLLKSEERNRIIIDSMSDLILIYDKNDCIREYFTSDESLLYASWEDMEGKRIEEFMPREYTDTHYEHIKQMKETGNNVIFEYQLKISENLRWFQGTMMLHQDEESTVVAIREITDQKQAEIALEMSEKRYRNLFLNAKVGLFRTNSAGQVLACNLVGAKLMGYENPGEVIDDFNLRDHYVDLNKRQELLDSLSENGEVNNFQAQLTRRDGTPFWAELSSKWYPEEEFLETVAIDITQRKETEAKLRESEERFRNIFESTPIGMFLFDIELDDRLIFKDANPAADKILGVDCRQFIGKPIEEAFPALTETDVPSRYKAAALNGISWHNEELVYEEGAINGAYEVNAFQTMEGKMVASFLDITERKKAQEALKSSIQSYRELMENLPAGVGIADLDDVLTMVNPAFCEILGYTPDELIGMNVRDTIKPEDHELVLSETEVRKTGESSTYEVRAVRKDGTLRDARISAVPQRDETGEIIGTIGIFTDISEAKHAEEALKASERRLRNLIEQLPLGVSIANLDELVELGNQALADILKLTTDEMVGSNLTDFLHQDSIPQVKKQTENRKQGEKSIYEVEMVRTDGVKRDIKVFAAPNFDVSGEIIGSVGIFQDISQQKQNEAIRAQQEQEINLYGSLLRHDLRNDLGLILSYVEAVQMLITDPDEEVTSFMNSALASVERMANLLKNFGRPQDVREVDIVDFIRELAVEAQEAEKDIKIDVTYGEATEPVDITAGGLLALVFMNLFRNSAQHAGQEPEIDVCVEKKDGYLDIIVTDNGPGVPEDLQRRLFARGTSSKGEAGGLGLYLCKQIVEGTGGSIELVNGTDGATFQILLPVEAEGHYTF